MGTACLVCETAWKTRGEDHLELQQDAREAREAEEGADDDIEQLGQPRIAADATDQEADGANHQEPDRLGGQPSLCDQTAEGCDDAEKEEEQGIMRFALGRHEHTSVCVAERCSHSAP